MTQRSAFRFQSPASEFEANIRLGLVTRLLKKWMVAPPVRNETFADRLGIRRMHDDQERGVSGRWISGRRIITRISMTATFALTRARKVGRHGMCRPARPASEGTEHRRQKTRIPTDFRLIISKHVDGTFLKNHGPAYAAMADVGQIFGTSFVAARVILTGKRIPRHHIF